MQYRAEIDGLRAVAVVPVLLFHAGFSLFGGGYVGVDIFFVISGFLITTILINELDQGRFSILNFYERRARRILPALFFVMAVTVPIAWVLLVPIDMVDFGQSLAGVALFSSNILFWAESGYFDAAAELKPMLHTWSLAVEEQYYILFPLLLMLTWRRGRRATLLCLVAIFIASLALAQTIVADHPSAAFYLLPTRAWELMVGSFIAFYLTRPQAHAVTASPARAQLGSLLGLVLIGYAIFAFDAQTPFPSLHTLVPVGGAALVILFAIKGTWAHALLSNPGCVGLGLISYSTYLWHQPLFAFLRYGSLEHPSALVMGGMIVLSVMLAYVSWRWVEQPFRAKGRIGRRAIFAFSGIGMAAMIALGGVLHVQEGLPTRFSPEKQALFASVRSSPKRRACHNVLSADEACHYFVQTPTWAAIGDSHAVELAYALASVLRDTEDGVVQFSRAACPPRWHAGDAAYCATWTNDAVAAILADDDITSVVVSYRIASHLFGDHENIYPAQPDVGDAASRDLIWQSYIAMLETLVQGGKRVHLVLQAPEVPTHINQLLRAATGDAPQTGGVWLAGVSRSWWEARMAYVTARLNDIPAAVQVHDPAARFCDALSCYLLKADEALYFDDNHLSLAGARIMARQIVQSAVPD